MKLDIDPKALYHSLSGSLFPEKIEKCMLFFVAAIIFLLIPLKDGKTELHCSEISDDVVGHSRNCSFTSIVTKPYIFPPIEANLSSASLNTCINPDYATRKGKEFDHHLSPEKKVCDHKSPGFQSSNRRQSHSCDNCTDNANKVCPAIRRRQYIYSFGAVFVFVVSCIVIHDLWIELSPKEIKILKGFKDKQRKMRGNNINKLCDDCIRHFLDSNFEGNCENCSSMTNVILGLGHMETRYRVVNVVNCILLFIAGCALLYFWVTLENCFVCDLQLLNNSVQSDPHEFCCFDPEVSAVSLYSFVILLLIGFLIVIIICKMYHSSTPHYKVYEVLPSNK